MAESLNEKTINVKIGKYRKANPSPNANQRPRALG
jgi:hypothetical protein